MSHTFYFSFSSVNRAPRGSGEDGRRGRRHHTQTEENWDGHQGRGQKKVVPFDLPLAQRQEGFDNYLASFIRFLGGIWVSEGEKLFPPLLSQILFGCLLYNWKRGGEAEEKRELSTCVGRSFFPSALLTDLIDARPFPHSCAVQYNTGGRDQFSGVAHPNALSLTKRICFFLPPQ